MNQEQKAKKSEWYQQIEENIQKELDKGIKNGDFKFYNVEGFLNLAAKIDKLSHHCPFCQNLQKDIEIYSYDLAYYINNSHKSRKQFEDGQEKIKTHLYKTHGVVTRNYYLSLYTFLGIFIGSLAGFLFYYMLAMDSFKAITLIFAAIGLIIGRILGTRKEKHLKKQEKVF